VTSGTKCSCRPFPSGVCQASVLEPVPIKTCVKNWDTGAECTFAKFADDTALGGVAGKPDGGAAVQRVLDRL